MGRVYKPCGADSPRAFKTLGALHWCSGTVADKADGDDEKADDAEDVDATQLSLTVHAALQTFSDTCMWIVSFVDMDGQLRGQAALGAKARLFHLRKAAQKEVPPSGIP